MSSRKSTFKLLGNAGTSVIILRILGIAITMLPTFYLLFSPSPDFMIYGILGEFAPLIGYLTSLIFIIFIIIALTRMDLESKLGIIFAIILLVLETLYFALYIIFYTLYIDFGVITPSPTFLYILIYGMMGLSALLGICYIIVFVILAQNIGTYNSGRDLKFVKNFTTAFGIFMGVSYIFIGLSSIAFLISGSPPNWVLYILLGSSYGAIVCSGLAALSLIIISTGYILFSKRE